MSLSKPSTICVLGGILCSILSIGFSGNSAMAQCPDDNQFTTNFMLESCTFRSIGENPYFILKPGYQLVLEGEEENETIRIQITVLFETKIIDLVEEGLGKVKTRVVEELEWVDGELVEISNNWFAQCKQTNAVYYFGEEVWVRDEDSGELVPGGGAWEAGVEGAMPGLIMPGTFILGSKYFQEQAPASDAVDRGENTAMGLTVETDAGTFYNCVEVVDTNPAEGICCKKDGDVKIFCPGIGLAVDEAAELITYGFVHPDPLQKRLKEKGH